MQKKRLTTKIVAGAAVAALLSAQLVPATALAAPPDKPPESSSAPSASSSATWSGATTYTSAASTSGESYNSTNADENAVLVDTSDNVTLINPTVTKSGGTSASDNYSFYGINSGIMCKGGGTTTITGATITTDAAGANGVFSYGANNGTTNATGDGTTVIISDSTITTTGQGSGGIMTTYGGTTEASNLTITTSGGSSAPIRTDRGGGWVTVDGGTYTSNGVGSPAIYSTADVQVSNATLVSNASEGTCIEGNGSIKLTNCNLTASNTTKNGNAQYYDTIMIYQSMSGDATGTGSVFTMSDGALNSKNGHVFHVTNTNATINLDGVEIDNTDSDNVLLSVTNDGWSGNENAATVNASGQVLEGDIIVSSAASSASSSASSLVLNLADESSFEGKIDDGAGSNNFSSVDVTIDADSIWTLTGDSYVTSISGDGQIDYNGYTLHVGSTAYTSGNIGDITEYTGEGTTVMYRLYNPNSGEHFYTADKAERNELIELGWSNEGKGWTAPESSSTPVYRLYNANGGEHHYTMNVEERDYLVSVGWSYEKIGWYSDDAQGTPLYRDYNPNAFANNHNYTTSQSEHNDLVSYGWQAEGYAWYGL